MGKCIVVFCKNRTNDKPEAATYHRIAGEKYSPWMKAIGRNSSTAILSPGNRICSEHFTQDSFIDGGKEKLLNKGAIPTLKLKPEQYHFVKSKESRYGSNNNPTAYQFSNTFKKLLS